MKQLSGAVHDLASEVVSVLRGGDRSMAGTTAGIGGDQALSVAAVRTLGADVLLPCTLLRRPPAESDLLLFREAVRAYPPGPDASPATAWSHWAMTWTLRRVTPLDWDDTAVRGGGQPPGIAVLREAGWQQLTHQLALLGALAVPGAESEVAAEAARRPVDVARGFVRAVRRRDWLQAAGAGRWLAVTDGVPESLGLDAGLSFVLQMGGTDPRVALHIHAARLMRTAGTAAP
jgi:hypothetical protein